MCPSFKIHKFDWIEEFDLKTSEKIDGYLNHLLTLLSSNTLNTNAANLDGSPFGKNCLKFEGI